MPYNNTPIAPPKEYTGTVSLPLARVKKIIAADEDINSCSNNAAFVIAVATEMFVQYLVERCHDVVKSERKPRRNIQYKDAANAVARIDNLEFLADVVPRMQSYKSFKEGLAKRKAIMASGSRLQAEAMGRAGPDSQQKQLPFGAPQDGQTAFAVPTSPIALRPVSHGHSRNHSLEQQNILHPIHPAHVDEMQVESTPPRLHPSMQISPRAPFASNSPETRRDGAAQQNQTGPSTAYPVVNGTLGARPPSSHEYHPHFQGARPLP